MTDTRQDSVKTWVSDGTLESINSGSLQRIADAAEKMALRYTELIDARNGFERWYIAGQAEQLSLKRKLTAAKGQITKLKKGQP